MAAIYFVILTPISFLAKFLDKDFLKVKFSNETDTYWIKREKDLGPMNQQF